MASQYILKIYENFTSSILIRAPIEHCAYLKIHLVVYAQNKHKKEVQCRLQSPDMSACLGKVLNSEVFWTSNNPLDLHFTFNFALTANHWNVTMYARAKLSLLLHKSAFFLKNTTFVQCGTRQI